mgnify:FL=1
MSSGPGILRTVSAAVEGCLAEAKASVADRHTMFKTQNIDVTELVLGVPGKTNVAWALAREVFSVAPTVARAFLPGSPSAHSSLLCGSRLPVPAFPCGIVREQERVPQDSHRAGAR